MKKHSFPSILIVVCSACVVPAAIYSQSPQATEITAGRGGALAVAAVGLISLVIGGLAWARSAGRIGIAAVALGMIGVVLSVIHLVGSTGFGSGGGRLGAIVALVLALVGMAMGGSALARSRRLRSCHGG